MLFPRRFISLSIVIFLTPGILSGQDGLQDKADSYRKGYRFREAAELYRELLGTVTDSLAGMQIEQNILMCENGMNFLRYASKPSVSASRNVPVKDFYLWCPELDGGWSAIPNPLVDQSDHPYANATFYPADPERIVYSMPDENGNWDIYETRRISDTLWSEPLPAGLDINTQNNEIFPIISSDGQKLWFSSDGLPGLGGYDLFVSEWNESEKRWGTPENLGFPYSSTADDILYMDTPDSRWSVLASTRDASEGTVNIYALEFSGNPIKVRMTDIDEIMDLAALKTAKAAPEEPLHGGPVNAETSPQIKAYTEAVKEMRRLKADYQLLLDRLDENRAIYENSADDAERAAAAGNIRTMEAAASIAKKDLDKSVETVRQAEMDFLRNGIMPPVIEEDIRESSEEAVPESSYHFTKQKMVNAPAVKTMIPEPEYEYGLRILETSQMAEKQELPRDGIVYQIQIMVASSKIALSKFKGIAPIFEKKLPSGKIHYAAGLFRSFSEASAALSKVKSKGFTSAFIIAYDDGSSTSVKNARLKERRVSENTSYNILISGYADSLPSTVKSAIASVCTKDIAKSSADGHTVFIVGPFTDKSKADELMSVLEAVGTEGVSMEKITQ